MVKPFVLRDFSLFKSIITLWISFFKNGQSRQLPFSTKLGDQSSPSIFHELPKMEWDLLQNVFNVI